MKLRLVTIVALSILVSCKKNNNDDTGNPNPPPPTVDKVKDTTIEYAREIYLWYDQIPTSFNAQAYGDPDDIMQAIRAYSTEPGFTQPVDRWSFAVKQVDWDNISTGAEEDFGINVFFIAEGDLRVRFVEKAGPAGLAGIRRGWRITKLNGSTNITTSNSDAIISAVYQSTSTLFTFEKPDGSSVDIPLHTASYQSHAILLDTVYTVGTKKLGYMVFNAFLGDTNEINSEYARIFTRFAAENVDDVAIDLRYNGGGYVSLAASLANYLVNSSGNGQLMMEREFNDQYPTFNESIYYQKLGAVNLSRVFFLVTENTASASELVINSLKPMYQVLLVGPERTYGKPVGYFAIPVGDWYIFPVSSRSTNKNGEGSYFDGLALDNEVADGIDKDFGDQTESCLASVMHYVGTGAFRPAPAQKSRDAALIAPVNKLFDARLFKGAITEQKKF